MSINDNGLYTLEILALPHTVVGKWAGLTARECSELTTALTLQPGERTERTFEGF